MKMKKRVYRYVLLRNGAQVHRLKVLSRAGAHRGHIFASREKLKCSPKQGARNWPIESNHAVARTSSKLTPMNTVRTHCAVSSCAVSRHSGRLSMVLAAFLAVTAHEYLSAKISGNCHAPPLNQLLSTLGTGVWRACASCCKILDIRTVSVTP